MAKLTNNNMNITPMSINLAQNYSSYFSIAMTKVIINIDNFYIFTLHRLSAFCI